MTSIATMVDMEMQDGLTGGSARVETDVVAVGMKLASSAVFTAATARQISRCSSAVASKYDSM